VQPPRRGGPRLSGLGKLRALGYAVKRLGYHDYIATPVQPPSRAAAAAPWPRAQIYLVDPPRALPVEGEQLLRATVLNTGDVTLLHDQDNRINLTYHWLDGDQRMAIHDGERTMLPRPIGPGDFATVDIRIKAPPRPGKYFLVIDLVNEGKYWFEQKGSKVVSYPIAVVPAVVRHPAPPR